jgi:hypothetical protein
VTRPASRQGRQWFTLRAAAVRVSNDALLADEVLRALAVEDIVWSAQHTAWRAREPRWWQRAQRATWRRDGQSLHVEAERISRLAARCGLWPLQNPCGL